MSAESSKAAEQFKVASGSGAKFYLSPDGNWLIWDDKSPDHADDAHRGLWYALKNIREPGLYPSHHDGWVGMPTQEQQQAAYEWRVRYCRHWFEKDSVLANTVTIAMAAYAHAVRVQTLEDAAKRCEAMIESLTAARDRASAAGRDCVSACRKSDIETLERDGAAIRAMKGE